LGLIDKSPDGRRITAKGLEHLRTGGGEIEEITE
jgi:hypothetical protein